MVYADEKKGFGYLGLVKCEKCCKFFFINSLGGCKCLCCGYENKEKNFREIDSAFFSSNYFEALNGVPIEEPKEDAIILPFNKDLLCVALYHPELKARAIELLRKRTSEYPEHIQDLLHIIEKFEPSQVRQAIKDSDTFSPKVAANFIEQLEELDDFGLEIAKTVMKSGEFYARRYDVEQEIKEIDSLISTANNEEEKLALLLKRLELKKNLRRERRVWRDIHHQTQEWRESALQRNRSRELARRVYENPQD